MPPGSPPRRQTGAGLAIHSSLAVTLRGSTFVGGGFYAVWISPAARADLIGLGAPDGGNVFQSKSAPLNRGGICREVAGVIMANSSEFTVCPPTRATSCLAGADVTATAPDGSIDTTGCRAP